MTTIRVARRPKFTQVHRDTVCDPTLSYRDLGVLTWLLDKPDDWETNAEQIAAAKPNGEGRDAVRSVLKRLRERGYLRLEKWRADDGTFRSEWTVFERPNATEPERISSAGDPSGLPAADSQGLSIETVTEDCPSSDTDSLRVSATSDCIRCRGAGRFYSATAGRDARCSCTYPPVLDDRGLVAVSGGKGPA